MSSSNAPEGGIGFLGVLAIVFIVLKLLDIIAWSWWWVLAPVWIPSAFGIVLIVIYLKGLKNDGSWIVLKREVGITTRQWKNLSVKVKAPKDIIAICLEFAINRDANDPVIPVVWIDDVNLTVE